jgi:hypothetical protein
MYTFGYSFKTWDEQKVFFADKDLLSQNYINEAADEYKGTRSCIIYEQRALSFNFDTKKIMDGNYGKYNNSRRNGLYLPVHQLWLLYYNYTKLYPRFKDQSPGLKEK